MGVPLEVKNSPCHRSRLGLRLKMFILTGLGCRLTPALGASAACLCAFLTIVLGAQTGAGSTRDQVMQSVNLNDPYLWLEDVTGDKALEWVRAENAISTQELEGSPDFVPIPR